MSMISGKAAAAREGARRPDGKFGAQHLGEVFFDGPTTLTEGEFEEQYEPQGHPDGDYLQADDIDGLDERNLWSVIETEDGGQILSPGIHRVNVLGFLRSEKQWPDGAPDVDWMSWED